MMIGQAEQQSEWIISTNLVNNGWVIDNIPQKNVYFQKARPEHQSKLEIVSKRKGYKKPDYILYQDSKPIGIIEAKAPGKPLKDAMKQAEEYAERLEAPLIFTSNGNYVETKHLIAGKPLYINGDEVNHIIKYKEAIKFIEKGKNEIYTISKELIRSKGELIGIFKKVNDLLRRANVFSGYDRINEFSNILFLKLISEQQGEKSYWNAIKKQDDDLLFQTLNSTIIKELENKFGGDVFSQTSIEKTSLFRQIMDMIDPLILSDIKTDIKGDAFEYFLRNMNQADNDLGQYFTPRHIVQYMVNLIDPKFGEIIYDPFCGTGGFLIETFNYIKENTIIKTEEQKSLLNEKTLFGRDATKVATIAKKNMILHGDGHSNIEKIDSLENPIQGKYDCVITNIPFSLKDVEYSHLYYDGLAKNNGDAMCVLHCLKSLKRGGRMAVIVPEGFLFSKPLKDFRERLLKEANLELIVSLPQGIFQPYTAVKTDILYFTNVHDPQPQKSYYYFVVNNDGYTLNKKRIKLSGVNDIHKLQSANLKRDPQELLIKNGFSLIDLEKVKKNNYNLVGSAYQKIYEKGLCKFLPLKELIDFESGKRPKGGIGNYKEGAISLGGEQIHLNGSLNLTKIPYIPLDFYHNSNKGFVKNGDILMCKDGALTGKTAYVDKLPQKEVMVNEHLYIIRAKEDAILQKYLFYVLHTKEVFNTIQRISQKSAQNGLNQSALTSLMIPLPSLEEQQRIVQELEEIEKSINHAQNLIESLKSRGGGILSTLWTQRN